MRRRLVILLIGFLCVAALGLGVLWMVPPRPGVTKANFDRVQKGMTLSEVEKIFGSPEDQMRAGWNGFDPEMDQYYMWVAPGGVRSAC